MSYIRRIVIEKYRSIERLDVDLSPRDGTKFRHLILTGPNGSGKSSALELIHAALPKLTMPAQPSAPCHVGLDEQPHDGGRGQIVAFFQAQRLLRIEEVSGPSKIDWMNILRGRITATQQTVQYLVNRKVEQSFARDDGDRRLRVASLLEILFRAFEAELRELEAEDLVGAVVQLARRGELVVEVLTHADGLCSLSGEHQRARRLDRFLEGDERSHRQSRVR